MASGYIRGITIEFGADTTKLNSALKKTQGTLSKTQSELRTINKSLKFNPRNTTLLQQKFKLLKDAVGQTEDKLKQLKDLEKQMVSAQVDKNSAQFRELKREIIKTEDQLKNAKNKVKEFGSVGKQQAKEVGNAFKTAGGKIKSAGKTISTSVSMYGLGALYAGKKLIDMAQQQAEAEQKLGEIYKSRMGVGKKAVQSTLDLASAQQKVGVVGDEVQLAGAQQLATYAKYPSTVNKLLPSLNNLLVQQKGVNGTQEDAVGLANLFGKAMMGQTGALKRAGISFTAAQEEVLKYGTEEEKAAMIAEVVQQNVGNMNEEFAKTDAGKIQQAKNELGDMGEQIGASLLPAVADFVAYLQENLLPKIQELITYIQEHPEVVKFALAFAGIVTVLGPVIMILGSLVSIIGTIISIAPVLGGAFSALLGPVGLVIAAVAAAIAIGVALYKNWDAVKEKISAIWEAVKAKAVAFKNALVGIFKAIGATIKTVVSKWFAIITWPYRKAWDLIKKIGEKIKNVFSFKFKLPKIKLPHFGVSPKGWKFSDLLKGSIPKLGIDWYAKGGIFNSPRIIGVGEAGAEAVLPISKLQTMMDSSNGQLVSALLTALQTAGGGGGQIELVVNLGGANVATEIFKLNKQGRMILEA